MWVKQGRIFHLEPSPNRTTHCQVPTPYTMPDGTTRVYYACRSNGKAFVAYFDLEKDFKTILKVHENPVFQHGEPGMFDSDGVMPSCIIPHGKELWLYYIGWNEKTKTARYHNSIGIAVSKDGGETFERMFNGPIMDRIPNEPGLCVMPAIIKVNRGLSNIYHMLYQSGVGWTKIGDQYEPVYVIKYACSFNGINWYRRYEQCVPSKNHLEAFSRPTIVYENLIYKIWYCYRDSEDYRGGNGSYRIGYAESKDCITFDRKDDESGIDVGQSGEFDSEMVCYPYVVKLDDRLVMFYNGNDFGQTGIGVAVWE